MLTLRRVPGFVTGCRLRPAVCVAQLVVIAALLLTGCGAAVSTVSGRMADGLSDAILNQDDPELVREGLPSYLLLLDSLARANPDSPTTLSAAAQLYSAYGAALVDDPERAKLLTARARRYGRQALCASRKSTCELEGIRFDRYVEIIQSTDKGDIDALYSYSLSSLAWIRANSDSLVALADLPKIEVALEHLIALGAGEYEASTCMYLGILNSLRPPALGGKPDVARDWFERGIALSEGRDLSIKVEYARGYARMLYDRELFDRLLNEVMAADVEQPDLILFNMLAKQQAEALLAGADDYF
jgi:hypothetical protein